MGATATDEKQALAEELVEARALVGAGEYEAAMDRLEEARDQAQWVNAVPSLVEIRRLAHAVWLEAPRGSDITDRADRLVLSITRHETVSAPSGMRGLAIPVLVLLGVLLLVWVILFIVAVSTWSL